MGNMVPSMAVQIIRIADLLIKWDSWCYVNCFSYPIHKKNNHYKRDGQ